MRVWAKFIAVSFFVAIAAAQPARAIDNWTVFNLGIARSLSLCTSAARESLIDYANVFGARKIVMRGNTLYAWGLARGKHDGVLICSDAGSRTVAQLIIYSNDNTRGPSLTQSIADGFYAHLERLTKDWLDEALKRNGF